MAVYQRLALAGLLFLAAGCVTFRSPTISANSDEASVSGAYLQGRFAAQSFDIPRAGAAFEEVSRKFGGQESNQTAFGYALASGDFEEAVRQARLIVAAGQEAADDNPEGEGIQSDLPTLTLASAAMRDGDAEEAAALLEQPLRSSLGRSLSALLRSAAMYEVGGFDAAAEALNQQAEGTFRGLVPLHASFLYRLTGDLSAAESAFRQSINAPRSQIAGMAYARVLEDKGKSADAATLYRAIMEDAGLYSRAGRFGLARLDGLEGSARSFDRLADKNPRLVTNGRELYALALESFAWLGFEQAIGIQQNQPGAEQLRRSSLVIPLGLANLARAVDPGRDGAHYIAAMIFGIYETPQVSSKIAATIPPQSWIYDYAVLEAANAQIDMGDTEGAISTLRKALRIDDGVPQWALQLHLHLAGEGRYDESDRAATRAIVSAERLGVSETSLWRYYFSRGAMRIEADRWEDGIADLEKALGLAPDEPLILNHLGYTYVERGENLERAFGMIERALEIDPQNGSIVDSLGWAHFQRGNYEEAVEFLERAVGLEPADAVITDHLGDAYYMTYRDREAVYEWRRVFDLEDADAELKAAVTLKLDGDFSEAPVLAARSGS